MSTGNREATYGSTRQKRRGDCIASPCKLHGRPQGIDWGTWPPEYQEQKQAVTSQDAPGIGMDDETQDRPPVPSPPGIEDTELSKLEAISGLRRSPSLMTAGAGNPQLVQAVQLLLQASQADPFVGNQLKPAIQMIIDFVTALPSAGPGIAPPPAPSMLGAPMPPAGGLGGLLAGLGKAGGMGGGMPGMTPRPA